MSNDIRPESPTPEIQFELNRLRSLVNVLGEANLALAKKLEPVLDIQPVGEMAALAQNSDGGPRTAVGKYIRQLGNDVEQELIRINLIASAIAF